MTLGEAHPAAPSDTWPSSVSSECHCFLLRWYPTQVTPGDLLWIGLATFRRRLRCDPAILVGRVLRDVACGRSIPLAEESPSTAEERS
jgi:hypothetical protein